MTDQNPAPKILIISGSMRKPSYTRSLSTCVAGELGQLGAEVRLWDAQNPALPLADPAFHHSASKHPDAGVVELDALATAADAFVFATPIYHNSYSGVLKNALDLLNIRPHFSMKPVGLVSHGGDRSPQAVDHLRIVCRGLNAITIPTQVCTQRSDFEDTDEDGVHHVLDGPILERVRRFTSELLALTILLRSLQLEGAAERLVDSVSKASGLSHPIGGARVGDPHSSMDDR